MRNNRTGASMREWILLTVLCGGFLMAQPAAGQETKKLILSLEQCEALALKNNPILKAAETGLERSRARQTQARNAGILPKLELQNIWSAVPRARAVLTETGVLISPDTSTGFSDLRAFTEVELSWLQPVFTFGKLSGLSTAAAFGVEVEEAGLEKKASDVRLLTRQLYWGLVLGKELVAVVEDTRKDLKKAEDKLNEMLDEGAEDVSDNDMFKLQIFKYEIDKRHRETLKEIAIASSRLRAAMGLDESSAFEISTEYLDPVDVQIDSLPKYIASALQKRPEMSQLRAGLGASRAMIGVSKSDYFPQFFLAGGVKYNFAQDRDDPRNPWVYNPTNFFRPAFAIGVKMN
ncbi:MAG: TolC family protein, partial [bacterium]